MESLREPDPDASAVQSPVSVVGVFFGEPMGVAPLGSFNVASFPGVEILAVSTVDQVEHGTSVVATNAGAPALGRAVLLIQAPHEQVDPVAGSVDGVSLLLGVPDSFLYRFGHPLGRHPRGR